MPAVDDPFGIAASLPGQMATLRAQVKDLSVNRTQSPAILTVGAGGLTVLGPTVNTGATALSGGVTGPVAATGALSGTSLAVGSGAIAGGAITGASVAVTGAATAATLATTGSAAIGADINLTGDLYTPHGKITPVVSGYVSAWLNGDGRLGATASTRASKRDLVPMTDLTGLMSLTPYLGRYVWDADDSPLKVFLIADEVQSAGFGPDVAPLDETGEAFTVNYSQMVVPLLAAVQSLTARLDAAGL